MSKWWGTYEPGKPCVIDDFTDKWWDLPFMLRLLDENPLKIEFKGGEVQFDSPLIVITSNHDPADWYRSEDPGSRKALARRLRLGTVEHFATEWVAPEPVIVVESSDDESGEVYPASPDLRDLE